MTAKFDGGPAFPQPVTVSPAGDALFPGQYGLEGMSLRDHFAGRELTRLASAHCGVCDVPEAYDRVATHCYRMADAMIRARGAL